MNFRSWWKSITNWSRWRMFSSLFSSRWNRRRINTRFGFLIFVCKISQIRSYMRSYAVIKATNYLPILSISFPFELLSLNERCLCPPFNDNESVRDNISSNELRLFLGESSVSARKKICPFQYKICYFTLFR